MFKGIPNCLATILLLALERPLEKPRRLRQIILFLLLPNVQYPVTKFHSLDSIRSIQPVVANRVCVGPTLSPIDRLILWMTSLRAHN